MNEPRENPLAKDNGASLLDYLLILSKYSRMLIYVSLAAMVLTYTYLYLARNQYQATARILPTQDNMTLSGQLLDTLGSGTDKPGRLVQEGLKGVLGMKSAGDTYLGILTGDTVADRLIERFKLREIFGGRYMEDARLSLANMSRIEAAKGGLIVITITDLDPKRAAEIANGYIDELDQLLQGIAIQEATGRLAFLERENRQTRINLAKAEENLRTFSEQSSVIAIDTQTKQMLAYIAQLRATIDAKEVELKVWRQQATPFNYDVIRLETELKGLREKLQAAETQWNESCIGDTCLPTSKTPALGLEFFRLLRQVKFQEKVYEFFTKMEELARMEMVKRYPVVQVVDRALPPERRSNRRLLPALLVGMGTFVVMVFGAFGREYWQGVRSREEDAQRLTMVSHYLAYWIQPVQRLLHMLHEKSSKAPR